MQALPDAEVHEASDGFLAKPFASEELVSRVSALLPRLSAETSS